MFSIIGGFFGPRKGDMICWDDYYKGENVLYRYPQMLKWNDNVVVQADEFAIFFRYGKTMHIFNNPGQYQMNPQYIPILSKLGGKEQRGKILRAGILSSPAEHPQADRAI